VRLVGVRALPTLQILDVALVAPLVPPHHGDAVLQPYGPLSAPAGSATPEPYRRSSTGASAPHRRLDRPVAAIRGTGDGRPEQPSVLKRSDDNRRQAEASQLLTQLLRKSPRPRPEPNLNTVIPPDVPIGMSVQRQVRAGAGGRLAVRSA
jgi:hypothetical protein